MNQSEEWRELTRLLASGKAPQSLLAIIHGSQAEGFARSYARRLFCRAGTGEDGCESCRAWQDDGHPDLVIAGAWDKAPGIEICLSLHGQLALHPVSASRRLAVIPAADKLSLPAANSLLKIAEEPPANGYLLFTAEQNNLLPTIKSRVWTLSLTTGRDAARASAPPDSAPDWADWLEKTKKKKTEEIFREVESWILWYGEKNDWRMAASLQNAQWHAQKRYLPVSMVQDMLYAILWEGIKSEQIFGDLREA